MTRKLILAISVVFTGASLALADGPDPAPAPSFSPTSVTADPSADQPVPQPDADSVTSPAPEAACQPACAACDCPCCKENQPCFWASGEHLLWWIKNAPLPPLGTNLDEGTFSGGRVTVGSWLNCERTVGLEGSGFLLEQRSAGESAAVTPRPVTLPFVGTVLPSGAFQTHTRLWGAEANGIFDVMRRDGFHADLLAGFRFLSLEENLDAQTAASGTFMGLPVGVQARANFQTQNRFYGGQLGMKAGGQSGRFSVEVIGKVGLGSMFEASSMTAGTLASVPGFTGAAGIVRRNTRDEFAVLPEAQVQVGYDVTSNARLFVGYNFLYVSEVLRPGDQTGTARGAAPLASTDFWAHGVNFGLQLRF